MLLLPALIVLRTSPEAWTDMAGALTYRGMNHVWQGCPANGGWHGSASADGVRWQDRGITVIAVNESWEGYTSHSGTNGSPCAGFATVDDDGTPYYFNTKTDEVRIARGPSHGNASPRTRGHGTWGVRRRAREGRAPSLAPQTTWEHPSVAYA